MQATTTYAPAGLDVLVERTLSVSRTGAGLVRRAEPRLTVPAADLPAWPPLWQTIVGSEAASEAERFIAYTTTDGFIATVQSTIGPDPSPSGRLIAIVGLGGHRLSVMDAGQGRFLARWKSGATIHQLTAGPTTLTAFMELVLNLQWC